MEWPPYPIAMYSSSVELGVVFYYEHDLVSVLPADKTAHIIGARLR